MIETILPAIVQVAEHFGPDDPTLTAHPLELSLVSRAVEKRRREFITTRVLARSALEKLGHEPEPILRGDKGAPLWPQGIIGSLTHCQGYRAAAVAYALHVRSIGIDAEPDDSLPSGVFDSISLVQEREEIAVMPQGTHWERVLFCAKEATYKAWFPLTLRWLGFDDAHIMINQDGTFTSRILIDGSVIDGGERVTIFHGKWIIDSGLIITAISVGGL